MLRTVIMNALGMEQLRNTVHAHIQRWDRVGRVGFGGMTRPARRPSGFRPSDRLGPMFWSLRATRPIIFWVSPRLGPTRSRTRPGRGRVSIHCNGIMIYESVLVLNFVTMCIFPVLPVFSIFYSFIRLFANKRIEYKVGSNKVLAIFVNTNKGAFIRLFDYSQLKTKLGE